jgi:hypothetical protein
MLDAGKVEVRVRRGMGGLVYPSGGGVEEEGGDE